MKLLQKFITEKLRINKDLKFKSNDNWSILNADDGDFVKWHTIYFIYKCLNKNHKYSTDLGENTIIYYAVCNSRTSANSFHIGPSAGVGAANENNENLYHLMNDDERENFLKIIKDNGYEWDDNKKELIKVLKL